MTDALPPEETAWDVADAKARARIREDLDTSLIVEAAAGTGKTTMLIARLLALVRSGRARLSRVVAVTFTEKAAGEMKLRLRAAVEAARLAATAAERKVLDGALEELEAARIATYHALCADLLRERPVQAEVDPRFDVGADQAQDRLLEQAFDAWYGHALRDITAHPGVQRTLLAASRSRGTVPREQLLSAARSLASARGFDAAWTCPDRSDRGSDLAQLTGQVRALAAYKPRAAWRHDPLAQSLTRFERIIDEVDRRTAGGDPPSDDELEVWLLELLQRRYLIRTGHKADYGDGVDRVEVTELLDTVLARLQALKTVAEAERAALLQRELAPVLSRFAELKRQAGALDFDDLLVRVRDMLVGDAEARRAIQGQFDVVLLDEFQDTSPIQAEIVSLLVADDPTVSDWQRIRPIPGKLFIVGDPKQAIYGFRRADVALYHAIKQRLSEVGVAVLHLTRCFRCAPPITEAVNAAFAEAMQADDEGSQCAYVPLIATREAPPEQTQPAVLALPVPDAARTPSGYLSKDAIDAAFPEAVGDLVRWLVQDSGWTVAETAGDGAVHRVPVQPRHVCLLFRRLRGFYDHEERPAPYVRALEARGVPHVLVGGRRFFDRDEVRALDNALRAIAWPDDTLSVFATLRGPLFGVTDDALLVHQARFGKLSPCAALRRAGPDAPEHVPPLSPRCDVVESALLLLGQLHRLRNRRPVADTLTTLMTHTRVHASMALWPAGEQTLANALQMVAHARAFEAAGAGEGTGSFRSFIAHAERLAEHGETGDAEVALEGTEGVRMMTAHKAKGLEFPVVILCDPTAGLSFREPTRYVDGARRLWATKLAGCAPYELSMNRAQAAARDLAEAVRLTYVAATRARDLLVAPVFSDGPRTKWPSWLSPLDAALYPEAALAGRGRPRHAARLTPARGRHQVLWWQGPGGPGRTVTDLATDRFRLLTASDTPEARAWADAHQAWADRRRATSERGSRPTLPGDGFGALVAARPELGAGGDVRRITLPRPGGDRPEGKRFGTLVHAILAEAPLTLPAGGAWDTALAPLARLHGRLLGAPPDEVDAAQAVATRALLSPILRRAAAATEVRRECPVALVLDDGTVGEGVVDLAFSTIDEAEDGAPRWVVVDYKTGREPGDGDEDTRRLVLYQRAIMAATGQPADAVLLLL